MSSESKPWARRTPFPAIWLKAKDHFARMKKSHTDSTEYHIFSERPNVNCSFGQAVLPQFPPDLGTIINFRNLNRPYTLTGILTKPIKIM